jgi:hypothetical protein
LNPVVAAEAFTTAKAAIADKIAFNHPKMKSEPAAVKPAGAPKRSGSRPAPKPTPKSR